MVQWTFIQAKDFHLPTRTLKKAFIAARCMVNRDLTGVRVQPRFEVAMSNILREKPVDNENADLGDDPALPDEPDADSKQAPPSVHKKTEKTSPGRKKEATDQPTKTGKEKLAKEDGKKDKSELPKSSKAKPVGSKLGKGKADRSTLNKGKALKAQGSKGKRGKEKAGHDERGMNEPEPDEPGDAPNADDEDELLPKEDNPEVDRETNSAKAKAKGKPKAKQGKGAVAKKGQKGVKPDAELPSKAAVLEDEEHGEDTHPEKSAQKRPTLAKKSEGGKAREKDSKAPSSKSGSKKSLKKAPPKKSTAKAPKTAHKPVRKPSARFAEEANVKEVTPISAGDAEPEPEDVPLLPEDQRTLFFDDGRRRIDVVLAYEDHGNPTHDRYRRIFHENLEEEGLDIEIVKGEDSWDGYTFFVKVHAPWSVLSKYAEQLHMRMPVKKKGPAMAFPKIKIKPGEKPVFPDMRVFESDSVEIEVVGKAPSKKKLSRLKSPFPYDKKLIPEENEFYNAEFVRQREAM